MSFHVDHVEQTVITPVMAGLQRVPHLMILDMDHVDHVEQPVIISDSFIQVMGLSQLKR